MNNSIKPFSVLMSLYDKELPTNLDLALKSIFNQTLPPDELVLVLDGPISQDLMDIVFTYKRRQNIKIVKINENVGLGKALQEGLNHCRNEYIARMDTDDICDSFRFEKQLNYLTLNPKISVVGGGIEEFKNNPGDLNSFRKLPNKNISKFAKFRNPLNHVTVIFKKSDILKVGSYEHMPYFEDYYLWIKLLKGGYKLYNINECLVHVKIGNDMIGRRHGYRYLCHEINFLKALYRLKFINFLNLVLLILLKLPFRLMPKFLLKRVYNAFLR